MSDKKSLALPANSHTLDSIEERDLSGLADLRMNKLTQFGQNRQINSHIEGYEDSEYKLNRSHRLSMTATEIKDSYRKPDDTTSKD